MSDNYERIDASPRFDDVRASHEARYAIAARYTCPGDVVVDAACGSGYGQALLHGRWIGVDKDAPAGAITADLNEWVPGFGFDVFVGIETIEHLADVTAYVAAAKRASRFIVISTPIVPNSNPFHLQQFTAAGIRALFEDAEWRLEDEYVQGQLYGLWAFASTSVPRRLTAC